MRQVIMYPGEDGFFVVECPSLPGCISQGKTPEEAITNIQEAIEGYIEALVADGLPVPEENAQLAISGMIDLSIVIVNYNTRQLLLDCLDSIYQTDQGISLECIVVDNVSSDGSVEAVRERYPQVQVIANEHNTYFSAGNNQGIQRATGRYMLALNPDTAIKGRTLNQLVAQMDANPQIGAATTNLYFPDGTLQRNGSNFVTFVYLLFNYTFIGKLFPRRRETYNEWLWYKDWDRKSQRQIDILPGSCIIAPKAIWQAAGGFDSRMLMYFSDDYFSRAVQRMGKQTVYLITDGIIHYEGASARQASARALRLYFHDLLVYTRLVFGRPAQILLAGLLIPTWIVQRWKARAASPPGVSAPSANRPR